MSLRRLLALGVWALIPETRGVSLEQIERKLMRGVPLRRIGR